jgi:DNA ligase 1
MIRFARLFAELDSTTKTNAKISLLADYFRQVEPSDAGWAVFFLSGNKAKRLIPTKWLRQWAAEAAQIPDWLFDECYDSVGDLAEAISLVVPPGTAADNGSLREWIEKRLLPLAKMDTEQQHAAMQDIWNQTEGTMRFVVMKLITGSFRVGVSARLVVRGIAEATSIPADVLAHRLMGNWKPTSDFYLRLIDANNVDTQVSQPYPFCLAHAIDLEAGVSSIGEPSQFVAEWKWDGIRGQVIRRQGQTFIWSRGEELMEGRWPEIEADASFLPDGTVLDGEILAELSDGRLLPFAQLQRRIQRKTVGKKLLSEVPVVFRAFDLIEHQGNDIRALPMWERRSLLESVLSHAGTSTIKVTQLLEGVDWEALATLRAVSREQFSEGLMLKRRDSAYDVGRVRGTWWKWKIEPYTIDAVLIYAQRGHGKRASLYTDYTFALWDNGELVPFAKAYSGLDDAEIRKVDAFIRNHTKEKFGPVRSVTPELVMELAFEGLQISTRHKSGIAVRFPRIARWRHDKRAEDANQLSELKALIS